MKPVMKSSSMTAEDQNYDVDIAIVGGGLSGLSAALTAAESGAKAIVLEKLSFLGGAGFLVISDLCARALPSFVSAGEFPVGVITGLVGGMFLLGLLFTGRVARFF